MTSVEKGSKAAWVDRNPALLWLKYRALRTLHFIDFSIRKDENELQMASGNENPFSDCPEWWELEKIPDAGKISRGLLVMHNGIRVLPTAYQGYAHGKLIERALGIHEPQEERLFRDVIQQLPANSSMIELGSYWSYYSMWFQKTIANARTIMVEPKLSHLSYGQEHFRLNSFTGEFINAGIGKESQQDENLRIMTVDELMQSSSLDRLSILHSDIQGYELEMLQGAEKALKDQAIDFFFISTHSDDLHQDCIDHLTKSNYKILDQYRIHESWNPDGLIVAQSSRNPQIELKPAVKKK
jgi:Methyltransferase FkbM domain